MFANEQEISFDRLGAGNVADNSKKSYATKNKLQGLPETFIWY